jgi:hypothetical protein
MGDKSRQAQRRGKLAGRRLLSSFERDDRCKTFDANTTNVVRLHIAQPCERLGHC